MKRNEKNAVIPKEVIIFEIYKQATQKLLFEITEYGYLDMHNWLTIMCEAPRTIYREPEQSSGWRTSQNRHGK